MGPWVSSLFPRFPLREDTYLGMELVGVPIRYYPVLFLVIHLHVYEQSLVYSIVVYYIFRLSQPDLKA